MIVTLKTSPSLICITIVSQPPERRKILKAKQNLLLVFLRFLIEENIKNVLPNMDGTIAYRLMGVLIVLSNNQEE